MINVNARFGAVWWLFAIFCGSQLGGKFISRWTGRHKKYSIWGKNEKCERKFIELLRRRNAEMTCSIAFDDKKQFELQIVLWMHKIWLLLKPNHLSHRPTVRLIFSPSNNSSSGSFYWFSMLHNSRLFLISEEIYYLMWEGRSQAKHKNAFW